jgi:HNH endonuclease
MQDNSAPRICSVSGCEARLRATNTIGRCREHAYIPAAGAVCAADGCDTLLRKDNRTGYCTPHKRAKDRGPVPKQDFSERVYPDRECPDCHREFIPQSANHTRCPDCQHSRRLGLRAEREGRNDRDTCSVDGCDAKLRTSNTIGRCSEHRYIPAARDVLCGADRCGKPLRKDNGTGYCDAHQTAKSREPARFCGAPGCERTIRTDNSTGYCGDHAEPYWRTREYLDKRKADYRAQPKAPDTRRTCSVDGCECKLRSDNTTGRCTDHTYVSIVWRECSVDGCETPIRPSNTIGRCQEHRATYWADDAPKCGEPGCGKTLHRDNTSGLCKQHYDEAYKQGNARAYYGRNQAALREYARQYREVYTDEHRAGTRAWNAANPEARQAMRARRRFASGAGMDEFDRELSVAYRIAIRWDRCLYCGSPDTDHVDHFFPLSKGGTDVWWNLVRACERDNLTKQAQCGTAYLLRRGRL